LSAYPKTVTDKRLFLIDKAIAAHEYRKDALLEILHVAHNIYGYIDKALLLHISEMLNIPPSQVYGVATFYKHFRLKPCPHTVAVCLGTACQLMGSQKILSEIEREFNVKCNEASENMTLYLSSVYHIGQCATAPNIIVNGKVIGNATVETAVNRIRLALKGEEF